MIEEEGYETDQSAINEMIMNIRLNDETIIDSRFGYRYMRDVIIDKSNVMNHLYALSKNIASIEIHEIFIETDKSKYFITKHEAFELKIWKK
ncbi:MAG: hypothetical protein KDK36_08450 [Leptospiraceae bacterium]|nr:hypothetical protein [Leptospiraceae bacterium]